MYTRRKCDESQVNYESDLKYGASNHCNKSAKLKLSVPLPPIHGSAVYTKISSSKIREPEYKRKVFWPMGEWRRLERGLRERESR